MAPKMKIAAKPKAVPNKAAPKVKALQPPPPKAKASESTMVAVPKAASNAKKATLPAPKAKIANPNCLASTLSPLP